MDANKSDLQQISSRKLVEKYLELNKEFIKSAREHRQQKFREQLEERESQGAPPDTGATLIEETKEVRAEIERRVQKGDVELDAIAAENLKREFQDLPERAMVNSLLGVEAKPQNAQNAAPKPSPSKAPQRRYAPSPEVANRRAIIKSNPGLSGNKLYVLFDERRISLPEGWERKYNVTKWVDAAKIPRALAAIQRIVSTDRSHG